MGLLCRCCTITLNRWSSIRAARWIIVYLPVIFVSGIIDGVCVLQNGTFTLFNTYFLTPFVYSVGTLIIMIVCTLDTLRNLRSIRSFSQQGYLTREVHRMLIPQLIVLGASEIPFGFQGISYNQPKLCANATWNQTAITFANSTTAGTLPVGMFINTNNSVYVADQANGRIQVWLNGSTTLTGNYSGGLSVPYSVFVTDNSDVYVDNGRTNYRVDKWGWNSTSSVPAMYTCGQCYSLFVDINNMLYCVMGANHQVVSKSLDTHVNVWSIVAGTGSAGSTSVTLNTPWGIFVDNNLNLYVADTNNNRIQKFASGQLNGTTIATGTIVLFGPTSVIFDADGYMFITDCFNQRLIGSGANGFRCIAACSGSAGSSSSQLFYPHTISFDSYGNIFVVDQENNRVQKFLLLPNSCNGTTTATTISTVLWYNVPEFTAYTSWSANGITFANTTTLGTLPYGIFIDTNNTIYVSERGANRVQVWHDSSSVPIRNLTSGLSNPYSLFVAIDGDIYVDNGGSNTRVDKWTLNSSASISAMYVKNSCWGLFIDINNNLYCSMNALNQVIMKSLNNNS
ncbi:unnamed protein product, partial [Adineta steineri]